MREAWLVCTFSFFGMASGREYVRGAVYRIVTEYEDVTHVLWCLENDKKAVFTETSLTGVASKFRRFENEFLAIAFAATLGEER